MSDERFPARVTPDQARAASLLNIALSALGAGVADLAILKIAELSAAQCDCALAFLDELEELVRERRSVAGDTHG
ncbi:MAG: hypothetical protein ABWY93_04815 [Mycobacterium sp.]